MGLNKESLLVLFGQPAVAVICASVSKLKLVNVLYELNGPSYFLFQMKLRLQFSSKITRPVELPSRARRRGEFKPKLYNHFGVLCSKEKYSCTLLLIENCFGVIHHHIM